MYVQTITGRRLHKGWWHRGQVHLRKRVQWWKLCQEAWQGIAQYCRKVVFSIADNSTFELSLGNKKNQYFLGLRGGIQKKKLVFFGVYPKGGGGSRRIQNFLIRKWLKFFWIFLPKGGGGLTQSKISVIRNCLFFFWKWGGVFPNPKFPYQKKLSFLLDFFCQKGGGLTYSKRVFIIKYWFLSSNTLFFHQILSFFLNFSKYFFFDIKKYFFISEFIQKGEGGVWPNPKFLLTEKDWNFFGLISSRRGGGPARSKISVNRKN